MAHKPTPPTNGPGMTDRRLKLAARILFESEAGKTDAALAVNHGIGQRTIKRWRSREAAGQLPEVTAELKRLRAGAADVVKLRAEEVLEQVYSFLERATKGNPKDPKMVEAMVKAGEFLADTLTVAAMMNVSSVRARTQDRAAGQPASGVGGGARTAAGAGTGRAGTATGTRVH